MYLQMKSFKRVSSGFPRRPDGWISLHYDVISKDVSVGYSADYTDYLKFFRSAGRSGSAA
jgi:hypothetical protein